MLICSCTHKLLAGMAAVALGLVSTATLAADDPLVALSDEFNNSATLSNWQLLSDVEGWNANQLQTWAIDGEGHKGRMLMVPHTSVWYQNWRGILAFKNITGDFVITTYVESTNRAGTAAPSSSYSLAGIMVRTPRAITSPADWAPGGENYIFLSLGAAGNPGTYQFEVKTTVNSNSTLQFENTGGINRSQIQVARLGTHFILLRRLEGGNWTVHRRYNRADMPATLQAGLTTYTDWSTCETYDPFVHNQTVILEGNPDLRAAFEYVRYRTPVVPSEFAGRAFSNPDAISDAELLSFLGDNANQPSNELEVWRESTFPTPAAVNARVDADYDGDGLSNLTEFILGTDPLVPNESPIGINADSNNLTIAYPQRRNIDGAQLGFETTSNLSNQWVSQSYTPSVVSDAHPDYQELQLDIPYTDPNSLFFRFSMVAE